MGDIADEIINDNMNGVNDRFEVKKYYIVWVGRIPGIYQTWAGCKEQVDKYQGAQYKSFICDYQDAERYFEGRQHSVAKNVSKNQQESNTNYLKKSLAVDAACSSNPGPVEYRGINVETGKIVFSQGPFQNGTNNIGEFLAIVHGLALLHKHGSKVPVYSDSQTAITWVYNKKANTTLEKNAHNKQLFELVLRAEKWLNENKYENPVLKWDTKRWGEIPADFQRKK